MVDFLNKQKYTNIFDGLRILNINHDLIMIFQEILKMAAKYLVIPKRNLDNICFLKEDVLSFPKLSSNYFYPSENTL